MALLIALITYTLHLVALPQGWVPRDQNLFSPFGRHADAVMGRDGTVAVLVTRPSNDWEGTGRLFVVHPNGRSVTLRSTSITGPPRFLRMFDPRNCGSNRSNCFEFSNVVLADDGTPFVTASYSFSGAYGGEVEGAFLWNGTWRFVPPIAFAGLRLPSDPENVVIGAAERRRLCLQRKSLRYVSRRRSQHSGDGSEATGCICGVIELTQVCPWPG